MNRRFCLLVFGIIVGLCLIAPWIAPYDPLAEVGEGLTPPSKAHILGLDWIGRDVFSRVIHGGARTLRIAAFATLIAMCAGIFIGAAAGSGSKVLDRVISLLIDSLLAIPGFVLALVILVLIGTGERSIMLAAAAAQIAPTARIARSAVLSIRTRDYVSAAEQLGASRLWIVWNYLLPNSAPILMAYAAVVFTYTLLNGAALAFLGLGGDPSVPDWGMMLYEGRTAFRSAPWIAFFPGVAITGVVLLAGWGSRINSRK